MFIIKGGKNVVNIFTMGSLETEALAASDKLLADGVFANVIHVSSPDLLLGNLAEKNNYKHLKEGLAVRGDLVVQAKSAAKSTNGFSALSYPPSVFGPVPFADNAAGQAQILSLGGRRIPIVSVHDGEPGWMGVAGLRLGAIVASGLGPL